MSWLNKSLSQLTDVTQSISKFTEDVLAAEPPPIDESDSDGQLAEYRRQLDYYKRELEKAMNSPSGGGETMEARIEMADLKRTLETKSIKLDELQIQVGNVNEELEDSINELTKVSKRNSLLSKQNSTLTKNNDQLKNDNQTLQTSLEEIDQVHAEELGELMKQREALKKRLEEPEPVTAGATGESDEDHQAIAALKAEIERLKAASPAPNEKALKQKMAKLQKSWRAKIDEAEARLARADEENVRLVAQIESLEPVPETDRDPVDHFQLAKAQRRIEELTELVEKYKLDGDKKQRVNDQLISDNSALSNRLNELTGTVAEQESVMLEFVEKIEKKEKDLVEQLKSTNDVVTRQNDELVAFKAEKTSLSEKMNSLVDCIRQAEANCVSSEEINANLKETIVELEEELEKNEQQHGKEVTNLESIIDSLQKEATITTTAATTTTLNDDLSEAEAENAELYAKIEDHQAQLAQLNDELGMLRESDKKSTLDNEEKQAQLDALKAELAETAEKLEEGSDKDGRIASLEAKVNAVESEYTEAVTTIATLEEANVKLAKQNETFEAEIKSQSDQSRVNVDRDVMALRVELTEANDKIETLETVETKLQSANKTLLATVADLTSQNESLADLTNSNDDQLQAVMALKVELADSRDMLTSMETDKTKLDKDNERLQNVNDALKVTVADLSAQNASLTEQNLSSDNQVHQAMALKVELAEVRDALAIVETEKNKMSDIVDEKTNLITALEGANELLKSEINSLEAEVATLNDAPKVEDQLQEVMALKVELATKYCQLKEDLEQLRQMEQKSKNEKIEAEHERDEALETIDALDHENQSFQIQLQEHVRREKELLEQVEQTTGASDTEATLKEQLAAAEAENEELYGSIEALKKEKAKMTSTIEALDAENQQHQQRDSGVVDELRYQLATAKDALKALEAKEGELESTSTEVIELKSELATQKQVYIDLQSETESFVELESAKITLESRNNELTVSLAAVTAENEQLRVNINDQDLSSQLEEARERIEELEEENAETVNLFEQLKELEKAYSTLKSEQNTDDKKDAQIAALINGQNDLRKIIDTLEAESVKLKAAAVDSGYNVELANQAAILQSHIKQREEQLKQSLRQNDELKIELQRMHQKAQENISSRAADETLAHLEAEKEQLHLTLSRKNGEIKEIANRLQETGSLLQVKTEQLDSLATELEEARKVKDKAAMTQEAMAKLSHLIRSKDVELEAAQAKNNSLMEILRSQDQTAELATQFEELLVNKELSDQVNRSRNDEIKRLEAQIDHVQGQFEQLQIEVNGWNSSSKEKLSECDQIESQCEEDELSIATLSLLVKKIKEKSPGIRGAPDGAVESSKVILPGGANGLLNAEQAELMASSVRNLKERCDSLEAKNTVMRRDNDALRDQLMNRRDRWDALEINSKQLGAELATRDEQVVRLKEQLETALASLSKLDKTEKERGLLHERLVETEREYAEELDQTRESKQRLQDQIEQLRAGLTDMAGSKNASDEKLQESQREQQKHVESLRSEVQAARKREKLLEKSVQELQQFIEHFRQQQESAQEERERVHHAQISRAERESTALRGEIKQIRQRMEAAQGAAQKLMHLEAELAESDQRFGRMRAVVDEKAIECDTMRKRVHDLTEAATKTVDKDLAKNIVLKYLALPEPSKQQGIQILSAVFGFTEHEAVHASQSSLGWRGWFSSSSPQQPSQVEFDPSKSLTELFVDYLKKEADTPSPMAFPANRMVGDIGLTQPPKHPHEHDKGHIEGRTFDTLLNGPIIPSRHGV